MPEALAPPRPASFPLPSLHALHTFEVAARLSSFTGAGRELGITQTAVSHQIKQLEEELGAPLFRRAPRGLTLTELGQAWLAEVGPLFVRLRSANQRLQAARFSRRPAISITTIPSFGTRWLVPRLGGFLARHPEFDVKISATQALVDFTTEAVDVGIRYGTGHYPGLFRRKLAGDVWLVVASPELLAERRPRQPRELQALPLLCDDHEDAWPAWFQAQGSKVPEGCRYTQLSDTGMMVEAAVRGQGVALARWSIAADELTSGRLERVFPRLPPVSVGFGYYLVGLRETFARPEVAAFRAWLLEESEMLRRPPGS